MIFLSTRGELRFCEILCGVYAESSALRERRSPEGLWRGLYLVALLLARFHVENDAAVRVVEAHDVRGAPVGLRRAAHGLPVDGEHHRAACRGRAALLCQHAGELGALASPVCW